MDASTTLGFLLKDEFSPIALKTLVLLKQSSDALVPVHWWVEVANGLLIATRRRRIDESEAAEAFHLIQTLPVVMDNNASTSARLAFNLAREYSLTVYDAAYLELAQRHGVGLATSDRALARAARVVGLELLL